MACVMFKNRRLLSAIISLIQISYLYVFCPSQNDIEWYACIKVDRSILLKTKICKKYPSCWQSNFSKYKTAQPLV